MKEKVIESKLDQELKNGAEYIKHFTEINKEREQLLESQQNYKRLHEESMM